MKSLQALNLPTFIVIVFVLLLIGIVFWYWYWSYIKRTRLNAQNARLICTLVIVVLVIFGIISFITLNPKINTYIILASLVFFYPAMINVFAGIYLQIFSKLNEQTEYTIDAKTGILTKIRSSGIELEQNGKIIFVPYLQILRHGFEYDNSFSITEVCLQAEVDPETDVKKIENTILNKILLIPYISDTKKFSVHAKGNIITIKVWLTSNQFKNSFVDSMKKTNLKNVKEV